MDWWAYEGLSERWQSLGRGHAAAANRRLQAEENATVVVDGDDRPQLAERVLDVVRQANRARAFDELRRRFAPAHAPFAERIQHQGQPATSLFMLQDSRIVVVVGAPWERPRAWMATPESVEPLLGVLAVGRSADGRTYAVGRPDGVHLTEGWGGPSRVVPWPTTYDPVHAEMPVPNPYGRLQVSGLVPFDDGDRVLLVSPSGVFLLFEDRSLLVHPGPSDFGSCVDEEGDDAFPLDLPSVHGAVSPDQLHLAVGHQGSGHRLLRAEGPAPLATVEPSVGHPQQAAFTRDGGTVLLSSRRGDQGQTVKLAVERLGGEMHWPAERCIDVIDASAAVGAMMSVGSEVLLGGTDGFIRRCDLAGGPSRGHHFVGGGISALDVTPDGRLVAVGTVAGTVHLIDLAPETIDPYAIGTRPQREIRRWIFWKSESGPLIW